MSNPQKGNSRHGRTGILCATAGLCALLLTGCRETNGYWAQRNSITLGAGDAPAHNRAVQTIDPWPVYAKNTDLPADGKRMMVGIKRYQENKSLEPEPTDTTERFANDGAGKPPGPGAP